MDVSVCRARDGERNALRPDTRGTIKQHTSQKREAASLLAGAAHLAVTPLAVAFGQA